MSKLRLAAMIGGAVICALGIGFAMQMLNGGSVPEARSLPIEQSILPSAPAAGQKPAASPDNDDQAALELQGITLTAAAPDVERPRPATLPATPVEPETPALGCEVSARAKTRAMAFVEMTISAPCFGNERVTVHHNGMIFTDVTDQTGALSLQVPALAERAVFIVAFANGKGAVATAHVPELELYDRVAVQWSGNNGFQIHAREFGADYGDDGHVWSGADAAKQAAGRVTRLGAEDTLAPQLAEVYTFPTAASDRAGTVALSIEAEVTEANCGRDVAAQSLELRGDDTLRTRDLVLSMPSCGVIGDFLVLNNLVDDLKIASR